jgi:predicted RNase H-like HicB family nuclease
MQEKVNMVYWQEKDFLIGFLEPYPDYRTQAESLDELVENLKDIFEEISSGLIEAGKAKIMEISV